MVLICLFDLIVCCFVLNLCWLDWVLYLSYLLVLSTCFGVMNFGFGVSICGLGLSD